MAKLVTLKPQISNLPQRLSRAHGEQERDRRRDEMQHWRAWYKTSRWQKLRASVLLRDLFTCQMCKCLCSGKGEAVADHKTPHRGDEDLFWDADNLQCICKVCHDSDKQREDRRKRF